MVIGDVVRFKGTKMKMTVEDIKGGVVTVVWFDRENQSNRRQVYYYELEMVSHNITNYTSLKEALKEMDNQALVHVDLKDDAFKAMSVIEEEPYPGAISNCLADVIIDAQILANRNEINLKKAVKKRFNEMAIGGRLRIRMV